MRYKRILLFRPDPGVNLNVTILPTGLGVLSELLERRCIEHRVIDLALGYQVQDLMKVIAEYGPDLVGASLVSFLFKKSYSILGEIKERFPGIAVVVGGPHVSMFRDQVMQACPAIDFAIIKEGEESFVELVEGHPPEEIRGLYCRKGEEIHFGGERKPIMELDRFPYPKYRKFEVEKYTDIIPIYSSRGCPHDCIFCGIKDVIGRPFRAVSNELLIEQIMYWRSLGHYRIAFADDNFTFSPERLFGLCALIEQHSLTDIDYAVWDMRADSCGRDLLVAMKKAGFRTLLVGVESASNRVLGIIRKGETIEEIERMIKDACELGFDVQLSFIIGSPGETVEDVEESFRFALRYPIKGASFFNLVPTPNTRLMEFLLEHDYLKIPPEEYLNDNINTFSEPLFETPEMSFAQRRRLLEKRKDIDQQIRRNYYAHRLGLKRFGALGEAMVTIAVHPAIYDRILGNAALKSGVKRLLGMGSARQ